MEEYIKNESEKIVEKMKVLYCDETGKIMNNEEEIFLRLGIKYGINLLSDMVSKLPDNITMGNLVRTD